MDRTPKHYVGASAASANKNLAENVTLKDSILSGGIGKKKNPCFKILDMRAITLGPHREVKYKGISFYLDINSNAIFQQGLKNNKHIFTIGTYEAIMTGPHVNLLKKKEIKEGHELALQSLLGEKRQSVEDKSKGANEEGTYSPDILVLDYRVQRKEQRLIFVMPVTMIYEGKTFHLKTKDISTNGIKLFLPRTLIIPDKIVQLSFDFFIKEQEEYADDSKKRFFTQIKYSIVEVEHSGDKTYVSLIQKNLNDIAKSHINQFINANRYQYKFDATDSLLAAQAKYFEHIYTHNLVSIPVFIAEKNSQQNEQEHEKSDSLFYTDCVIETPKNVDLIQLFRAKIQDVSYDFSAFMYNSRLDYFAHSAFNQQSSLLFVYEEKEKLHSICDFEFEQKTDLADVVLKVRALNGKVFCVNPTTIKHPSKAFIKQVTESFLIYENHDKTQQFLNNIKQYHSLLMLTDVTESFNLETYFSKFIQANAGTESPISVKTKGEKTLMSSGKVIAAEEMQTKTPERLVFDALKTRYDTRYEHKMPLILHVRGVEIKAASIDFSIKGVGVDFIYQSNYQLLKNDIINVTFPEFNKKIKTIDFTDIEFKIAGIVYKNNQVILGLTRIESEKTREVGQFFEDLINKNKTKLNICAKDLYEQTQNKIIASYLEMNINSVPLVIAKDKENGQVIKKVGLNQVVCRLADHFFLKLRGYNFKILTTKKRLKQLYNRTVKSSTGALAKDQSFYLFMYKETNEQGMEYINSYTSYEMLYKGEVLDILDEVFLRDGACIKFSFTNSLAEEAHVVEQMLKDINEVNRHIAINFKNIIAQTVGCVDLVDVTHAYRALYALEQ